MLKSGYKSKFMLIDVTDYKAISEYLESMAMKGYFLTEIKRSRFIFKKGEPRDLEYKVALYYPDTPFDYEDSYIRKEFIQMHVDRGWDHVVGNRLYQIFCKDKDKVTEAIQARLKPEEEFKYVKKTLLKTDLIAFMCLIMVMGMMLFRSGSELNTLLTDVGLVNRYITPFVMTFFIIETILYKGHWFINCKRSLRDRGQMYHPPYRFVSIRRNYMVYILVTYIVLLSLAFITTCRYMPFIAVSLAPAAFGIVYGLVITKWVNKNKRPRGKNIVIFILGLIIGLVIVLTIVFYVIGSNSSRYVDIETLDNKDDLLLLTDFRDFKEESLHSSYDRDGSILIPRHLDYYQMYRTKVKEEFNSLISVDDYTCVSRGVAKLVYRLHIEDEERFNKKFGYEMDISPIDCDKWNIDEGIYLNKSGVELLLRKDKKVIRLDVDDNKFINDDFILKVQEKLLSDI